MSSKFFPIKTDTACQLKWNWSTLYLHQGKTASCHRTGWSQITPDTFDSFHNTPEKLQDRQYMLAGQWPANSCAYCREIEAVGGTSDRQLHLTIPNLVPRELDADTTAISVTPTILEIFLNNTCNLSCLYCLPSLSSKINQENITHGDFVQNGIELKSITIDPNHGIMLDRLWAWLERHSQNLRRIHVLGGEPFYQREFDRFLEYFEQHPHPNLEFNIVTNLMLSPAKLEMYIAKFQSLLRNRHLGRIDITCSIDCAGPEQEFVRYGLNMKSWLANMELILQQKWLTVSINQTISLLTIKTMPELLEYLTAWRKHRKVGHTFSLVTPQPSYLDPQILGPGVFDSDFDAILKLMPKDISWDCMDGIAQLISNSVRNDQEILKLRTFLDEKDRRRKTNRKQTFPWLAKEIEHVV